MDTSNFVKIIPKPASAEPPQSYKLSPEQMQFYQHNGYLVIKGLIDFATLYACKQRFIQIAKQQVDKGNITVVREPSLKHTGLQGEDLINKLQEIAYDDVFSTYIESPVLLDVVSQFVGPHVVAIHSMFINKPPGTARHPPHQDLYYFPFRPADSIVAAWTAVDDVTTDNGCLWVVPGSHKAGTIYEHGNLPDSNKLYHGILLEATVAPPAKRVDLPLAPGDTVLFHPLLVHGSGPNVSRGYRKSVTCHYMSSRCRVVDVRGSVQQPILDDALREAERRGFVGVSFEEVWLLKSKHVKGLPPSKL